MSFRFRALVLVVLIVFASTAVTAWLTLDQANTQLTESVAAGRDEAAQITATVREHGLARGGWDGVGAVVSALAGRTGQRIRVVDESGAPLADSDVLGGREARQVVGAPILVDPGVSFRLPQAQDAAVLARLTTFALYRYRTAVDYSRCLAEAGAEVVVRTDDEGIPLFTPAADTPAPGCAQTPPPDADVVADSAAVVACPVDPPQQLPSCLQRVFTQRAQTFAPRPVQVYLGAVDQSTPPLAVAPIAALALAVAVVAVLGALLLSRGVLRPVSALTGASRRLGAGDLSQRVRVSGRDEIAELGRSFNRMADSLQAGEERQRRLVGDVAHELRTPLANLRGYLEALRDGVVAPTPELLDSLHEEVLLQQRIVQDLQDLALAEAGTLTYHRTDVDLAELLETCRTAHRALADRSQVALVVDVDGPAVVHGDPDRLRQVFANLVVNAVRATPPGGTVRLSARSGGDSVLVEVSDTGTGIPQEDLPHLFDRFWRADASRGRSTGGSGLGLAIVRQIVTDHRGTIEVRSTVGVGTVFTVALAAEKNAFDAT
ncbi:sensor histidine kinase [Lentzea sp. NPDC059081]|uniref:sensor histidine kinase n=1 Tax=Lentzea sp. NPDC059081 TaxID=3346719 RepID=UPI0036827E2A